MGKLHATRTLGLTTLLWAGLLSASMEGEINAVESATETFVARAAVLRGTTGPSASETLISPAVVTPAVYSGTVSSVGPGRLTDATATWQSGQFNGANGTFYIQFESGLTADIVNTDANNNTLTFPGTLPESVPAGSTYRIRKHLTLGDILGSDNEAGLLGGLNGDVADNVLLNPPDTQITETYFFYNQPGFEGWFDAVLFSPVQDKIVYPEQGLLIRRKSQGDVVVFIHGIAHEGPAKIPVFPGNNLLGVLSLDANLQLDDLNLYTGDPDTGLAAAQNPDQGDVVKFISPEGFTSTFWYSNNAGFEGWYDTTFSPAGSLPIPPGTTFLVMRKVGGLFHWTIPQN